MNYLVHHGILGQKWGVRRFQNEDGSVTPAGARRYYDGEGGKGESSKKTVKDENRPREKTKGTRSQSDSDKKKKAAKIAAGVTAAAAVTAGTVIAAKYLKNQKIAAAKVAEIAAEKKNAEAMYKMYQNLSMDGLTSKTYYSPEMARFMNKAIVSGKA